MGLNNLHLHSDQRKNHRGQMKLAFDQLLPSFFKISTQMEDAQAKKLKPYPRVMVKRLTQRQTELFTKRKRARPRPRVICSDTEFEPDPSDMLDCSSQPLDSSGSSCGSLPDLSEIPNIPPAEMNNDKNSKLSDKVDPEVLKRITYMKQEEGMPNATATSRSFIRDLASDSPNQKEKGEFNKTFNRIFQEIREDRNSEEKGGKHRNASSSTNSASSQKDFSIQDKSQEESGQSTLSIISPNKNQKMQKKSKPLFRRESFKHLDGKEGKEETNSNNNSKSFLALKKNESSNNNSKSLTLKKDDPHSNKSSKSLYSKKTEFHSNNSKSLVLKKDQPHSNNTSKSLALKKDEPHSTNTSKPLALKKDEPHSNVISKSLDSKKDESHSNNISKALKKDVSSNKNSKSLASKKDKSHDAIPHMVSVPSEALTQFTNYPNSKIDQGIQTNEEIVPKDDSLFSQSLDFVLKQEKSHLDKKLLNVASVENLLTLGTILNNCQRILKEHRGNVEQEKEEKVQKLKKKYNEKCEEIDSFIELHSKMERELMHEKSRLYNGKGLSQEFRAQMQILLNECSNQEETALEKQNDDEASEPKENSLSYCNISEGRLENEDNCSTKITSVTKTKPSLKSSISITPVSNKDLVKTKWTLTTIPMTVLPSVLNKATITTTTAASHSKVMSIQLVSKEEPNVNYISTPPTPTNYENTSLMSPHPPLREIFTSSGKISDKSVGELSAQSSKPYQFEKHSQMSYLNSEYSPAFKRIKTSIENNLACQDVPGTATSSSATRTMNIEQVQRSGEHNQKVISSKLPTTSINQTVSLSQPKFDRNSQKVNLAKPAVIRTIPEANFNNFGKIPKDTRPRLDPKSSMKETKSKTPSGTSNPLLTLQSTLKESHVMPESVSQTSKVSIPLRFSSGNLKTSNISQPVNVISPITTPAPSGLKRNDYSKPQISLLPRNKSQGGRCIDVKVQSKEFQKSRNTKLVNIQPAPASQPSSQTVQQPSPQAVQQPSHTLNQPQFSSFQGQSTLDLLNHNYQILCPTINQSNTINSLPSAPIIFANPQTLSASLPQGTQFQSSQHSSPRFQLPNHPPPSYTDSLNPPSTYQSSQQNIQSLQSTGILPHLINPLSIQPQCIVNSYLNTHQSIPQENTSADGNESSYSLLEQCLAKNPQSQEGLGIIIESTTSISDFDNQSDEILPADPPFDIASESCFLCGDSAQVFCCGQFFYCGEKCKETDRARHQEECQTNK